MAAILRRTNSVTGVQLRNASLTGDETPSGRRQRPQAPACGACKKAVCPEFQFCPHCGARARSDGRERPKACRRCGLRPSAADQHFCEGCGTLLPVTLLLAKPAAAPRARCAASAPRRRRPETASVKSAAVAAASPPCGNRFGHAVTNFSMRAPSRLSPERLQEHVTWLAHVDVLTRSTRHDRHVEACSQPIVAPLYKDGHEQKRACVRLTGGLSAVKREKQAKKCDDAGDLPSH
ncbi:hypothetical protein DIPPA_11268 [Diplonema papillatum]|nr:hypothetical protein DIPPA_11268 [Diplonema papillatum]